MLIFSAISTHNATAIKQITDMACDILVTDLEGFFYLTIPALAKLFSSIMLLQLTVCLYTEPSQPNLALAEAVTLFPHEGCYTYSGNYF